MSDDLIKRSDAIEAMEQRYQDILRIFKRKVKVGEQAIALDMIGCIKSLPSADRPQGEWITIWDSDDPDTSHEGRCSECGRVSKRPLGDFCKWCGARMKGADDE